MAHQEALFDDPECLRTASSQHSDVEALQNVRAHYAGMIAAECGGRTLGKVLEHLSGLPRRELLAAIHRCSHNAKAGQTMPDGTVIGQSNPCVMLALLGLVRIGLREPGLFPHYAVRIAITAEECAALKRAVQETLHSGPSSASASSRRAPRRAPPPPRPHRRR